MAVTTSQLDRIAALVDLLLPLGGKQPGMRVEAADWNAIVDALRGILEIDRVQEQTTQLGLDANYAPRVHDHLGQVSLSWLDVDLQGRLGESSGSLSMRSTVADMGRRLDTAAAEVARLTAAVEGQQRRNDDAVSSQIDQASKLRGFEDRFTNLEDMRGLVSTLGAQVQGLGPAVQTVLDLRTTLTDPTGTPIDVGTMQQNVQAAQARLQDGLTGVDGTPARIRDLQVQVAELQDALGVTPGGLDTRIQTAVSAAEARLDQSDQDRIAALRTDLGTQIQQSLTQFQDTLPATVADQVQSQLPNAVPPIVQQAVQALLPDAVPPVVQQVIGQAMADLRTALDGEIAALKEDIEHQIADLTARVARLEG